MDKFNFGFRMKSHGPPGDHTTPGSVGSAGRMRLGTLVAAIFAIVLASLAIALVGVGLDAHPAAAQSSSPTGAWGWGQNNFGQLGDGTLAHRNTPVAVKGISDAVDVSAGQNHGLALKKDGTVWSWGINNSGQLGRGFVSPTPDPNPRQVNGISTITEVESSGVDESEDEGSGEADSSGVDESAVEGGGGHSLALQSDGTAWAWGSNSSGQLGDRTFDNRNTPVQVSELTDVITVQAGQTHSLALTSDGTVWAWGNNSAGQLGTGGSGASLNTPTRIEGLTNVTAIYAGPIHSLAIDNEGSVWSWGLNNIGQLGDGTTTPRRTPVKVKDPTDPTGSLTGVKKVVGGMFYTLAIKENGTVWAWGQNSFGQLGDGTTTTRRTPVKVKDPTDPTGSLTGAIDVAATNNSGHVIKADGKVWSWGSNNTGQLGDGTTTNKQTPVEVRGLGGIKKISAGVGHILALSEQAHNTPPTANAGGPYYVDEGGSVTLDGSRSSDPEGTIASYAWDLDGDGQYDDSTGQKPTFSAADLDGPSTPKVGLEVTDDKGAKSTTAATADVNVLNVAPTLSDLSLTGNKDAACLSSANTVGVSFSFDDPAKTNDTYTGEIDWGDGEPTTWFGSNSFSINESHEYKQPGTYKITVNVTDEDGGQAAQKEGEVSRQYQVSKLLAPVNDYDDDEDKSVFKQGSTIPLKVEITDCDNNPVSGLTPSIEFTKVNPTTPAIGINEGTSTSSANDDFMMRWSATDQMYIYNLDTKSLADGDATYAAIIQDSTTTKAFGSTNTQDFGLRSK